MKDESYLIMELIFMPDHEIRPSTKMEILEKRKFIGDFIFIGDGPIQGCAIVGCEILSGTQSLAVIY